MTKHIQQRGYADCGVACIAMITEVEYERVLASVPPDVYFHGLYAGEIIHAIKKISGRNCGYVEVPELLFLDWWKSKSTMREEILIMKRSGNWDEITKIHYIYTSNGRWYFDPIEEERINHVDYIPPRKDWKVVGTIN